MREKSRTYVKFLIFIAFVLAFAWSFTPASAEEPGNSWCRPRCVPPTATATPIPPTATPTVPPLQACQVTGIRFLEDFYSGQEQEIFLTNTPINVRVSVADHLGQLLVGANVDAEVTRNAIGIQSTNPVDLEDMTGNYDGIYTQTENPGIYHFLFTVSDPAGERFLPCTGEAEITVTEAVDNRPVCEIILETAPDTLFTGDTIFLTATVSNTNNSSAEVTATVNTPAGATDSVPLLGGSSIYTGSYSSTAATGLYTFSATATDPTGENFRSCSVAQPVPIQIDPRPAAPIVRILPNPLETTLCSLRDTMQVRIEDVVDLAVVEMELSYDKEIVQVIDADAARRGVQVRVNNAFSTDSIFENQVDTDNGIIRFGAGVIGVPAISGSSGLIAIDFRPQHLGSSAVAINSLTLLNIDGTPIHLSDDSIVNSSVTVNFVPNCAQGSVVLEGRSQHGGVVITNSSGDQTVTLADGSFGIVAGESLRFEFPGYLDGWAEIDILPASDQPVELAPVTLAAGDVNDDDEINVLDLAFLAQNFLTNDRQADINADGTVDIFDLVLLAGNYLQAVAGSQ